MRIRRLDSSLRHRQWMFNIIKHLGRLGITTPDTRQVGFSLFTSVFLLAPPLLWLGHPTPKNNNKIKCQMHYMYMEVTRGHMACSWEWRWRALDTLILYHMKANVSNGVQKGPCWEAMMVTRVTSTRYPPHIRVTDEATVHLTNTKGRFFITYNRVHVANRKRTIV